MFESIPPIIKRRFNQSQSLLVGFHGRRRETRAMLKKKPAQTPEQKALAKNFARALEESGVAPKAIAEARDITEQAVSNWKRTGKIAREHLPTIAMLTGWSVERLLSADGEAAPPQRSEITATAIPHAEFQVSESQWALIQDFDMLPEDEKQALRASLRAKADNVRRIVAEVMQRQGVTGTVSDARVASAFGVPPPSPQPEGPAGPSDYEQHRITQSAIKKVTARKQKVK